MSGTTATASAVPRQGTGEKPSVDELRADVERTREELAETVDALGARLDIKARTRARLQATRQQAGARLETGRARAGDLVVRARASATNQQGKPTPLAFGVAAGTGAVLAAASVTIWRMSR